MFDGGTRLVLCNDRYIEMYGLDPDAGEARRPAARPAGAAQAHGHVRRRCRSATSPTRCGGCADKKAWSGRPGDCPTGRVISVSSRPMADGGWVATHQDITERRRQDQERDRLVAHEQRRVMIDAAIAAFRQRVEAMLEHGRRQRRHDARRPPPRCSRPRARPRSAPRAPSTPRTKPRPMSRSRRPPPTSCRRRSTRSAASSARPATSSASRRAKPAPPTTRSARWRRRRRRSATWSS